MKKIILTLIITLSVTGIFAQTAPPKNYNTGSSTNEFILKQNFPNPFNEVTLIVFDLMKENYIKELVISLETILFLFIAQTNHI